MDTQENNNSIAPTLEHREWLSQTVIPAGYAQPELTIWEQIKRSKLIKVILIIAIIAGIVIPLLFLFLLPNIQVTSITLEAAVSSLQTVEFTPGRDEYLLLPVGGEVFIARSYDVAGVVFSSCDYSSDIIELSGNTVRAVSSGVTELVCRADYATEVESNIIHIEVVSK